MKKIVRKSHEKEIAYELSKKSYTDKPGRVAILAPPRPDRVKAITGRVQSHPHHWSSTYGFALLPMVLQKSTEGRESFI